MNLSKTVFCFLLMLTVGCAHAGKARDMLDAFLEKTDSMQAGFQQKLLDGAGFVLQESSGKFKLKRPGKFLWDYSVPYEQKIVSNGKTIWVYDSELEQVSIKPYSQLLSGAPVILLDRRGRLDEEFEIEDRGLVDGLYQVLLKPLSEDREFKEIRVGLSDGLLRSILLIDTFDQSTRIEFIQMRANPVLDDSLFEFVPPKDADVVGEN